LVIGVSVFNGDCDFLKKIKEMDHVCFPLLDTGSKSGVVHIHLEQFSDYVPDVKPLAATQTPPPVAT
jgi:hypothetical protein